MKAVKMKTMEEILDDISENISRIEFTKIYGENGEIIFDLNTVLKNPENANEVIESFCNKKGYINFSANKNATLYINPEQVHAVEVENYIIKEDEFLKTRVIIAFKKENYFIELYFSTYSDFREKFKLEMKNIPYIFVEKNLKVTENASRNASEVTYKLEQSTIKIYNNINYSIRRLTATREDFQNIIRESRKKIIYYIEIPENKLYSRGTEISEFAKISDKKLDGNEVIEAAYVIEN